MTDLVKRLRDPSGTRKALRYEAADEIERLRNLSSVKAAQDLINLVATKDAEIERLREDLGVVDAWRNKVIAENAKLQAVVDED